MPSNAGSILITGGSGFLGSHLARRLVIRGEDVHLFVRPSSSLERVEDLLDRATIWRGDLLDRGSLHTCLEACRPNVVFHFAGDTSVRRLDASLKNVLPSLDTLTGTLHLIEELQQGDFPVRCLIRAGGLEEYGRGPYPYSESQRESPVSPYSATQVATAHYCQMLQPVLKFDVVSLRLALIYGPAQPSSFFIPSLIHHFLGDRDFAMTSGEQGRDLVFVDDAIDAVVTVSETEGLAGQIINIGSGQEYSMASVAEGIRILSHTSGSLGVGALAGRPSEIQHLVCDNRKALDLIGWRPRTSLAEGLARTIAWHRERAATGSQMLHKA